MGFFGQWERSIIHPWVNPLIYVVTMGVININIINAIHQRDGITRGSLLGGRRTSSLAARDQTQLFLPMGKKPNADCERFDLRPPANWLHLLNGLIVF